MLRNRHAADALADVRAEIKQLQIREAELRNELLRPDADRCGEHWEAVVCVVNQERVDGKAAVVHFGRDVMRPFLKQTEVQSIRLKYKGEDQ